MASNRIIIPIEAKEAPPTPPQQVEGRLDHARLAALVGVFAFCGSIIPTVLACVFWPGAVRYWPHFLVVDVCFGLGVSAWFGFNWLKEAARRVWKVEDIERDRRWKIQDREMEENDQGEPVDNSKAYKVYAAGYQILAQHYLYKKDCTRPEMEKLGITQEQWNAVNDILIQLKVKGPRSWQEPAYEKALALWEKIDVDPEACAFLVADGAGSWKRVHV